MHVFALSFLWTSLVACERPLDDPDLEQIAYQFTETGLLEDTNSSYLAGPDPFVEGEERLSLGIFYEGPSTESLVIDNVDNFAYIYEDTFGMGASSERVEGEYSDQITQGSVGWWGGGIHFGEPQDLSKWVTLHVSLWSEFPQMEALNIHMQSDQEEGAAVSEAQVSAAEYGFAADGQWHHLTIPLDDFVAGGIDLSKTTAGFMYIMGGGTEGDTILIDNVYYESNSE
jgi:hypothetical protein